LRTSGKRLDVAKAIRALREQQRNEWGDSLSDDLKKRYYEAKKIWNYATRLAVRFD